MSTHILQNTKNKNCSTCKENLPLDAFSKNSRHKDGLNYRCRSCSAAYDKNYAEINRERRMKYKAEYRKNNREKIAEYASRPEVKLRQEKWQLENLEKVKKYRIEYHRENKARIKKEREEDIRVRIQYLFTARRSRAKKINIPFTITVEYLLRMIKRQNLKCALTGIPFDMKFSDHLRRNPLGLSIDKIVPKKGYVKGNVQLVCNIVNMAKGEYNQEIFDHMCRARVEMLNGA